jgi:hypothetical protein
MARLSEMWLDMASNIQTLAVLLQKIQSGGQMWLPA